MQPDCECTRLELKMSSEKELMSVHYTNYVGNYSPILIVIGLHLLPLQPDSKKKVHVAQVTD